VDERFHCSFRDLEHFGDFFVRQSFLVAEDDRCAPFGTKRAERLVDRTAQRGGLDLVGNGRRKRLGNVHIDDRISAPAAHGIEGGVVRDSEDPTGKAARRIESGETAERLDEGVLRNVFGQCRIAYDSRNQVEDGAFVTADSIS
jgi:hypothetical protein